MSSASQPQHLSKVVSELIARRGLARVRGDAQLREAWNDVAGDKIAAQTIVMGVRNGILQIGVPNAALLSELASFQKFSLLQSLRERYSELNVRKLKFRLKGQMTDS